jgi:transcriptional regulator with XRE-family HTH domain
MAPILTNREPFVNTFREREISQGVDNGGMDFHANLRAIRELRGISQTALALACGWENPTRVTNYESQSANPRNRRKPSYDDLLLLAEALQVPPALLFSETPPKQLDQKSDLRSPPARLDAATLRNANLVLTTLLGASSKFDLDRDSDLISLAYTWTADQSDTALYEQLVAAANQRKPQGGMNDSTRRDEGNAGRAGGAGRTSK